MARRPTAPDMSTVAEWSSPSRRSIQRPAVFAGRPPLAMLALGFSAGLPAVLVFDLAVPVPQSPHSSAKPSARHTSLIRWAPSCATRRPMSFFATVITLCRLTAHACFIPSSGPRTTSEGTSRMVEVIGAIVSRDKYPIAEPRVRTSTGRDLSGAGNR